MRADREWHSHNGLTHRKSLVIPCNPGEQKEPRRRCSKFSLPPINSYSEYACFVLRAAVMRFCVAKQRWIGLDGWTETWMTFADAYEQQWVVVPLAATVTARTSRTPSRGTTVVSPTPRCVRQSKGVICID